MTGDGSTRNGIFSIPNCLVCTRHGTTYCASLRRWALTARGYGGIAFYRSTGTALLRINSRRRPPHHKLLFPHWLPVACPHRRIPDTYLPLYAGAEPLPKTRVVDLPAFPRHCFRRIMATAATVARTLSTPQVLLADAWARLKFSIRRRANKGRTTPASSPLFRDIRSRHTSLQAFTLQLPSYVAMLRGTTARMSAFLTGRATCCTACTTTFPPLTPALCENNSQVPFTTLPTA